MEKVVEIDGRPVRLKATGGLYYRYKEQFGRELITDMSKVEECFQAGKPEDAYKQEAFSLEVYYNILWTLAKTADSTIPPPQEWLDSFESFPIFEVWPLAQELLNQNNKTGPKNAPAVAEAENDS